MSSRIGKHLSNVLHGLNQQLGNFFLSQTAPEPVNLRCNQTQEQLAFDVGLIGLVDFQEPIRNLV